MHTAHHHFLIWLAFLQASLQYDYLEETWFLRNFQISSGCFASNQMTLEAELARCVRTLSKMAFVVSTSFFRLIFSF